MKKHLHIGILALQGDFAEHAQKLRDLGCEPVEIRRANQLESLDGLIIPGGESTTNAKLEAAASSFSSSATPEIPIFDAIKKKAQNGMPVWGTCMGSILLAKEIEGSAQGRIGLMDISVRRNAFGPQRASAEIPLEIPALGDKPFPGIFIRAPLFIKAGKKVEVLCTIDEGFVMAREGNLLATAFHPEITSDDRVHRLFLNMIGS
ncbi:MAG: pyridoxal 5'-phosphate synthase glutaminase subunit PdxT [Bacteroidota bacterium]|nr:pyridoxal 5'-phosphate synthase glutaminase subunit PdxT [Bacteroidota bacterium]